jgi:ATP-dependent DNA ligase
VPLPFEPPLQPMLAKLEAEIPTGDGWIYEPKWDGFRCVVFRDGDQVELASRNERPLTRYFPELLDPIRAQFPEHCVVDGEIVIAPADAPGLDFDALLQRIHPAESRIKRLAAETPASFVAFDLLALGDRSLPEEPFTARRALLLELLGDATRPIHITPATTDAATAEDWFSRFEGGGLDGVIAKRADSPYSPNQRTMVKVKHDRTAECVVAGFRIHKDGKGVGSLLLGLYDDEGVLHHVGVASGFTAKRRAELLEELTPLTENATANHPWKEWAEAQAHEAARLPGARSRWNAGKDLSWVPMRLERVAEVRFGQLQTGRFRHGVSLLRWRPDRSLESCTYEQLDVADPVQFAELFG